MVLSGVAPQNFGAVPLLDGVDPLLFAMVRRKLLNTPLCDKAAFIH